MREEGRCGGVKLACHALYNFYEVFNKAYVFLMRRAFEAGDFISSLCSLKSGPPLSLVDRPLARLKLGDQDPIDVGRSGVRLRKLRLGDLSVSITPYSSDVRKACQTADSYSRMFSRLWLAPPHLGDPHLVHTPLHAFWSTA